MAIKYLPWIFKVTEIKVAEKNAPVLHSVTLCYRGLYVMIRQQRNQPGNNRDASTVASSLIYRVSPSCPQNILRFNISSLQKEIKARGAGGSVCVIRSTLQHGFT